MSSVPASSNAFHIPSVIDDTDNYTYNSVGTPIYNYGNPLRYGHSAFRPLQRYGGNRFTDDDSGGGGNGSDGISSTSNGGLETSREDVGLDLNEPEAALDEDIVSSNNSTTSTDSAGPGFPPVVGWGGPGSGDGVGNRSSGPVVVGDGGGVDGGVSGPPGSPVSVKKYKKHFKRKGGEFIRHQKDTISKEEAIPFLLDLAVAYHTYGAPTSHIELLMTQCCEELHLTSSWNVFPSTVMVTFGDPGSKDAITRCIRNDQGLGPFSKFYDTQVLIEEFICNEVDLQTAKARLDAIRNRPRLYNRRLQLLGWAISSAASSVAFYGASWLEMVCSFFIAIFVCLVSWYGEKSHNFSYFSTLVEAVVASVLALLAGFMFKFNCVSSMILGTLIWEFPGISLTLAMHELATKNIITGTSRIFYAFVTALMLGYGIAVGTALPFWTKIDIGAQCISDVPETTTVIFIILATWGFNILLDIKLSNFPGTTCTSVFGYLVNTLLQKSNFFTPDLCAFLSAFLVGILSNLLSRWKRGSSILFLFTGLMLLAPGSMGVKGAAKLLGEDYSAGGTFTTRMITIGASLTLGSLIATALLPPRIIVLYGGVESMKVPALPQPAESAHLLSTVYRSVN